MLGACEILVISMLAAPEGGITLQSKCATTRVACEEFLEAARLASPRSAFMGQCVEVGALVDAGRK